MSTSPRLECGHTQEAHTIAALAGEIAEILTSHGIKPGKDSVTALRALANFGENPIPGTQMDDLVQTILDGEEICGHEHTH